MGEVHQFGRRQFAQRQPSRPKKRVARVRRGRRRWLSTLLGTSLLIGLCAFEFGFPLAGCSVKGNISRNTGARIYHVPGQEDYLTTRINWFAGERWFCSEAAASNAGWRRARR